MNNLIVFSRNSESEMELVNFGKCLLDSLSLLDGKAKGNTAPLICRLNKISDKSDFKYDDNDIVISETFNGNVISGVPWELSNPKLLGYRISDPFFAGDSEQYLEEFAVKKDLNLKSAMLDDTVNHLYFVQAMRHFINRFKS